MRRIRLELPTLALIAGLWAAFGLVTYFHASLPVWAVMLAGMLLVTLHGSLSHEALHGHPTGNALVNEALIFIPISLWFPFRRYRKLHLIHHRNDFLTDPAEDPESYYFDPQAYAGVSAPLKALYTANNTMLGRFLLGPAISTTRFWWDEFKRMLAGEREIIEAWALHAAGLAMLFGWLIAVCGMNPLFYVFGMAYFGNSLAMMRSYAEHRAHDAPGCRTIVVESGPVMSLLFLNNNLHMAHHEAPPLAWYKLPAYYRQHRARLLAENCAYLMKGYREIAWNWLLKPKEPVAHPNMESLPQTRNALARH